MKPFLIICLGLVIAAFYSCSSSYLVSRRGDKAEIILQDRSEHNLELVMFTDTSIVVSPAKDEASYEYDPFDRFYYIPLQKVKSISVDGYGSNEWLAPVCLFQIVPAGLFAAAVVSHTGDAGGLFAGVILAIPALISIIIFSSTDNDVPSWNDNMDLKTIDTLKIYSRYPGGLNQSDLERLLKKNNQKTFLEFQ